MRRRAPAAPRELVLVSLAYTMGFMLLNCSLGKLQASFSETVRSLEPLSSFVLARILSARGSRVTHSSAASLLAVLLGGAVSVYAQPAFDVQGFVLGLLANFGFSSRGLLVTGLQDATARLHSASGKGGEPPSVDPIGLFAAQHSLGLLLLMPAALATEGTQCAVVLAHSPPAARAALFASIGFVAYNFLSLIVLLLIDAVSHAVCNACRRAALIIASAVLLRVFISPPAAVGICLIIGGSAAYALTSAAVQAPAETEQDEWLRSEHERLTSDKKTSDSGSDNSTV